MKIDISETGTGNADNGAAPESPCASPTMQSEKARTKKWAPKTFNGCLTCKRRRIKCDEGKPSCQRCIKSNIKCTGYAPPKIRLFEPVSSASSSADPSSIAPSPSPDVPPPDLPRRNSSLVSYLDSYPHSQELALVPSFGTEEEYRSFQFFLEKTAGLIPSTLNPTWHQPAIKHSIIALANLHQSLTSSESASTEARHTFMTHYNTAIRALITDKPPIDVVLASCVIFWVLENFNGSGHAAFDHMKAAIKILGEWKAKRRLNDPAHDLISTYIEPTIRDGIKFAPVARVEELEDQIAALSLSPQDMRIMNYNLSPAFDTLAMASDYLADCIDNMLALMSADPDEEVVEFINEIDAKLYKWLNLFQKLTATGPVYQRRILVVHHVSAYILLDKLKEQAGLPTEVFQPPRCRWTFVVHEVEDMLKHDAPAPATTTTADSCTTAFLGFIPPMFLAASSAPKVEIRRRAINALRLLNLAEGSWNTNVAATIAEAMLDIMTQTSTQSSEVDLKHMKFGVDVSRRTLYLRWEPDDEKVQYQHVDKEIELDDTTQFDSVSKTRLTGADQAFWLPTGVYEPMKAYECGMHLKVWPWNGGWRFDNFGVPWHADADASVLLMFRKN
ncbi:hypothetical protein LTR20_003039 [Exophiala xenobiotica]|nr:hypothetical protein LTR92_009443 [Exophiala xenobiotica]KAK5390241.1 hypothetical protein LTS13_000322 [Exophiala xenobiotica]KAK5403459.1 hypothetical protein LTR79_000212 [Exophiala xenobiotica]KAK5422947.1 hypothetical protein LTR90_001965 [Exophiala xenobiotica]KAK5468693.1 hypothetical protein LTR20_003039 [Exophiala xenobiotica]